MPRIFFCHTDRHLIVESQKNLMKSLIENNVPVASSCGGDAVCAKCVVTVVEGMENLSPKAKPEKALLEKIQAPENVRLSCQVSVRGDIKLHTDYW